jgi:hypothetical protein
MIVPNTFLDLFCMLGGGRGAARIWALDHPVERRYRPKCEISLILLPLHLIGMANIIFSLLIVSPQIFFGVR